MKDITDFKTLAELITHFDSEVKCSQHIALRRWGINPKCPHCWNEDVIYTFSDGIYYKCAACRKKFTVRVGTIFQDSKLPLQKWFIAIYLFACRTKPVSSLQLSKDLGITQKAAWHVLHRLRYGASHPEYKRKLHGDVEADEAYIGGLDKNKHQSKRESKDYMLATWKSEKAPVFGMVERNQYEEIKRDHKVIKGKTVRQQVVVKPSTVVVRYVTATTKEQLEPAIIENIQEFSRVITDEYYVYNGLDKLSYMHATIKHAMKQYVVGDVHTNTIENFWSTLKRGIFGIYHFTSKKHLQAYLEEFAYRFNHRALKPHERFDLMLKQSNIGPLMYKTLIKKK